MAEAGPGVLGERRGGVRVISLVAAAHFMSHVYNLALPPLFPVLKDVFDTSYTGLGLAMSAFAIATAAGQIPVGFLVDRIGAKRMLLLGLILQAGAVGLISLAPSYWALLALFTVAGLAHTVYHPADYAILSATVAESRLGRAFSIHAFSGNLGGAVVPAIMVALTALWSWRSAFLAIGAIGIVVALVLWSERATLPQMATVPLSKDLKPRSIRDGLAFLFSFPILLCFLFYVIIAMGTGGIRMFSVAAIVELHDAPLAIANGALTGFLLGTAGGVLIGGLIADRFGARTATAVIGLLTAAMLIAVAGGASLSIAGMIAVLTAAGIARGLVQATRDLMVYSATPAGAHGKVFAFVSSGSSFGNAVMPIAFGVILDQGGASWVFYGAALTIVIALLTFAGARRAVRV